MNHFIYSAHFADNNTDHISLGLSGQDSDGNSDFHIQNLWLSNNQLVKYKCKEYLLLIDGVIYEFINELFSEAHYPRIVEYFNREGESIFRQLKGEFVMVIMNLAKRQLWMATSESGNTALFYMKSAAGLYFSNSVAGVLKISKGTKGINYQRIYDVLTGNNLGSESTCYKPVIRLLPGHCLKVINGSVTVSDYSLLYNNRERRRHVKNPLDIFNKVYTKGISYRLNADRIGIALSSGKDSTSVTAMVQSLPRSDKKKVFGYCYKPSFLSRELLSDLRYNETILLSSFYKAYPETISREVVVGSGSVLASLENAIQIYGEPLYGASNQFWIQKMHEMMIRDRCEIMLTGQGGNYTISWPPPELMQSRKTSIRSLYRMLKPGGNIHRVKALPYVSKEFMQCIDREHFLNSVRKTNIDDLQTLLTRNSVAYTGYLQKQASLHYGLHISDPTLDRDLIDFCLSIPFSVYHNHKSSRNLVTQGMKGLLPEEIRNNKIRGVQGADIRERIHAERGLILEKLMFLNKNKLVTFVLEIGNLVSEWNNFNFYSMSKKELNHLLRIIQMGIFLSEMEH